MMTPAWGNQSRGNTPRRESCHTNGSNNQTRKPPTETTVSETPSPVIKMPPKKFYDYPEQYDRPYYDRRPSLFQVTSYIFIGVLLFFLRKNQVICQWLGKTFVV